MNSEDNPLLAIERQRFIQQVLEQEGAVRTAELKQMLQVSAVTIRADLRELESAGICQMIWGGAVYIKPIVENDPLSIAARSKLNSDAKSRIGLRGAQLLEVGQTVILDAGTTTVELARSLSHDLDYLRIVTPALNVAAVAAQFPQVELVVTGGILRNLTHSLIGPQTIQCLSAFNADWAFIASGGYSVEHGVTTGNILEVEVKQTMIEHAARVVLLSDSSKCGTTLSLTVAPITDIDILITDTSLPDKDMNRFIEQGVEVIRV